jgi:hypothetical protein
MALKYAVDATLIKTSSGVTWTPLDYLVPMLAYNGEKLAMVPTTMKVWLLVWALPFIWIGVTLSVWDAPRRLAFDVVSQPPPLQEWGPYTRVYAPHLDGFFRTSHGEFTLIGIGGGRTRLEGRTWYTLAMQPAAYWTVVADGILHAIHARVLEHIKSEAER